MADSLLFQKKPDVDMPAELVEGAHTPDALAGASGVYIAASGSAMLQNGIHNLRTMEHWLWLAVESGTLTLENRMRCLRDLKDIGFQTGCGIMIGTPHQTPRHLAEDMMFMAYFRPEMIGLGPFIPHKDTPFRDEPAGSIDLTLLVIALCRIMLPDALIPSTTALGTVEAEGRQKNL